MKKLINILLIVIICLSGLSYYLYKINESNKNNIENLRTNLNTKDNRISSMTFKVDELKNYLKEKDSKHKIEIDSILKVHQIKIKDLKKYTKISTYNLITDTIESSPNKAVIINDSIYKINIKVSKKCVNIEGFMLSKDSTSKFYLTKSENNNNIYITESYKKSFWDHILFRKGKLIKHITSDCGNIDKLDEINIDK